MNEVEGRQKGHATLTDLKRLAAAMSPDGVIPVHSFHPEQFESHFPKVKRLKDGEPFGL